MAIPPTTRSSARLWLRASPRGTRSGFVVLPDGAGGILTITVLPKPWAPAGGSTREIAHEAGATTHLVMHETEFAAVLSAAEVLGEFAVGVNSLAEQHADLLAVAAPPADVVPGSEIAGSPFRELIDLMLLADRVRLDDGQLAFEGNLAPSVLRLLTQERLLGVVEKLLFRARPRYVERTETLTVPRGRLSEGSLLLSQAIGLPQIDSTFDELTTDTPILQVVASALRVVASDHLPRRIAALRPTVRSRAVQLLRHLSSTTLIERERAILVAERLWLGPLDRAWQSAVDAALPVLRERAVLPEEGTTTSDEVIVVHVRMEKFWEQCLQTGLETAFTSIAASRDGVPGEGVRVPAPWGSPMPSEDGTGLLSDAFPDFMFQSRQRIVLVDAKYKLHMGMTPSSQDGYQFFAYSHLATFNQRPSNVGVILYPGRAGAKTTQQELKRMRDHKYPLWLATIPFPTRTDVRAQATWSAYIAHLAAEISELSNDWILAPRDPAA
jgi:hypothetical protein